MNRALRRIVPVVGLLSCAPPAGPGPFRGPVPAAAVIDTAVIGAHARFLAGDQLEGRGAGTEGARLAADYLAAACRVMGLEPLGRDFGLPVPLVRTTIDSGWMEVTGPAGTRRFTAPQDFVTDLGEGDALTDFAGSVVFLDPGNPRAGLSGAAGAVVVVDAVRDRRLLDTLSARRAAGLVIAVPDSASFDLYRRSRGLTRVSLADSFDAADFRPDGMAGDL